MTSWLTWLEQTGASVWMRESPSLFAFPFILFLHTLGLAMLAGISVAIGVWLLREGTFARTVPMKGFHQVMGLGFGINALSGVALLLAYPAKALTNPIFYAKLALIGAGVLAVVRIGRLAFPNGYAEAGAAIAPAAKRWAAWSLIIWAATILTGRLLAYTSSILLTTDAL